MNDRKLEEPTEPTRRRVVFTFDKANNMLPGDVREGFKARGIEYDELNIAGRVLVVPRDQPKGCSG